MARSTTRWRTRICSSCCATSIPTCASRFRSVPGPDRLGAAEGRRAAARKHRGVFRGDRGDGRAQADPRSLLLRVERVRLRGLARFRAPRQHAATSLSRLLPRGRALDGHRLAVARGHRVSRVALGPRCGLADGRARHDDADRAHRQHDGGRRPSGRALEHPRRRATTICAYAARCPSASASPIATWLAVAAYNLGFGHLEDARILTQMQGADPDRWEEVRERLAAAERQGLVQPRAARLRAGPNRRRVRRQRAPLLRDSHVARQPRDADVARVRAAERRSARAARARLARAAPRKTASAAPRSPLPTRRPSLRGDDSSWL